MSEEVALLARIDGSGEQLPDPRGLWQFTAALSTKLQRDLNHIGVRSFIPTGAPVARTQEPENYDLVLPRIRNAPGWPASPEAHLAQTNLLF